jgi:hypothetical protein
MCNESRKQYTIGTLYEHPHVPLNKWSFAVYLTMASKKGMSAHQNRPPLLWFCIDSEAICGG